MEYHIHRWIAKICSSDFNIPQRMNPLTILLLFLKQHHSNISFQEDDGDLGVTFIFYQTYIKINIQTNTKTNFKLQSSNKTLWKTNVTQCNIIRCPSHDRVNILVRCGPVYKVENKFRAQLVFVDTLLIAVVGLTFPWINKIFYITVCFDWAAVPEYCSVCAHPAVFCCCVCSHLLNICLSVGIWISHCLSFLCLFISVSVFSLSLSFVPTGLPGTLPLSRSPPLLSSSRSHRPSHIFCLVSRWVPGRGRPWSDLGG